MVFSIIITILALGAMVCIHELGHMIAAKSFGVLVKEFSIGMGPKLFSVKPRETVYSLRLLPIGGYVQMEGEGYEEGEESVNKSRSFRYLKAWKRFIILAAGASLNIILGLVLFTIINKLTYVQPAVVTGSVDGYENVSVFQAGDEILKIDGTKIHTYQDLTMKLAEPGIQDMDSVDVVVRRDGEKLAVKAPLYESGDGKKLMLIFGEVIRSPGLLTSVRYAGYDTAYVVRAVIKAVGDLITGRQALDTLGGPVEIVATVDNVTDMGLPYTWLALLSLFALITVNLGVFNLLPIPALDGGQILFLLIEKLTRREIKPQVAGTVNAVFFALLMVLAVYVTIGDIAGLVR